MTSEPPRVGLLSMSSTPKGLAIWVVVLVEIAWIITAASGLVRGFPFAVLVSIATMVFMAAHVSVRKRRLLRSLTNGH